MPAVTFHGKLKDLDNKELVIVSDDEQELTIYRTHKTKFLKDGKNIKPNAIPIGASLTLDVSHAPDLSLLAVNVLVDPQPAAAKK